MQKRRLECREVSQKTLSKTRVGIHGGKTMPTFFMPRKDGVEKQTDAATVEWYKVRRDGKATPQVVSQRQLFMNRAFYCKPD
mgnify:CR=1 FL=1